MNRYVFLLLALVLSALLPAIAMADDQTGVANLTSVGYIQIQSPVDGARVYFDTRFMGFIEDGIITVPVDPLARPQYTDLIIEYTGYETFVGSLPAAIAGKTVGVRADLNKVGYGRTGIVQFESGISGAELFINGQSVGTTPDSGVLMLLTIPDGLYEFMVKRPGSLPVIRQQYVTSNAVTTFRVDLQPALTGVLQVNSTPQGAGIYLDNRYTGLSPLSIPDVAVGNQTVRITKDGYQEWTGEVTVIGAGVNQIDAVLVSLPPTPTPECPPPVQSSGSLPPAGASTLPVSENKLTPVVGIIILISLIGCVIVGVWAYRRNP